MAERRSKELVPTLLKQTVWREEKCLVVYTSNGTAGEERCPGVYTSSTTTGEESA